MFQIFPREAEWNHSIVRANSNRRFLDLIPAPRKSKPGHNFNDQTPQNEGNQRTSGASGLGRSLLCAGQGDLACAKKSLRR
jgi:hypothetical protein